MKSKYILFPILGVLAATSFTGCYDMDTNPMSQYITEQTKTEAKEQNPDAAAAGITGITAVFSTYCQVVTTASNRNDTDFGFPGIMLGLDSRGVDMIGPNSGYNWFQSFEAMVDCSSTSDETQLIWGNAYRQIFAANAAVASINPETQDPTLQFYLAQALGMRAYDYLMLAQLYQFTYSEQTKNLPCVMLVTEKNQDEAAANGIGRATVEEVYAQIMSDLDRAVALLQNAAEANVTPERVLTSKPKRFLSVASALGLRARANLVMKNYKAAAKDATAAIANFKGSALSRSGAAKPGFLSLDESNWMWGIAIAPTDRVVTSGIINWPSHLGSFNYGYASVGAWRLINKELFAQIPETDVRRGWFLDENAQSANLSAAQQEYIDGKGAPAYTQVKFAPYNNELGISENANDVPLMRIEEMYLIKAEGEAMGVNAGQGAQTLTQFVQNYRDPSFTCSGSAEEVQEACFQQRRVELFGEGLIYFDYMRLNKDFNRLGGGFPTAFVYNVPAGSQVLIYPIPEGEVNGNKFFDSADNNSPASRPQVITDTTTPSFAE